MFGNLSDSIYNLYGYLPRLNSLPANEEAENVQETMDKEWVENEFEAFDIMFDVARQNNSKEVYVEKGSEDDNALDDNFELVDPDVLLEEKDAYHKTAEKVVSRSEIYGNKLREVSIELCGLVIPKEIIKHCLFDISKKKEMKPQYLAYANDKSYALSSRSILPLNTQEGKNKWNSLAILESGEVIVENGTVPTSRIAMDIKNKVESDLTNFKYQLNQENGHICISCGGIDSTRKADEFVAGLIHILKNNPNPHMQPLRVVLHQVNSFANDSNLIFKQHELSRYIESQLSAFLNDEENEKYNYVVYHNSPIVAHINLALNAASFLPLEDSYSVRQNVDGLAAQVSWMIEDLQAFEGPLDSKNDYLLQLMDKRELLLDYLSKIRDTKDRLVNAKDLTSEVKLNLENIIKDECTPEMSKLLKDIAIQFHGIQESFKNSENLNEKKQILLAKLRIMSIVIAKQHGCLEQINEKVSSRVVELELGLLLDFYSNNVTEMNCKSGIDRTGFARALWDSLHSMQNMFAAEFSWGNNPNPKAAAYEKLINFVLNQENLMIGLDKLQQKVAMQAEFVKGISDDLDQIKNRKRLTQWHLRDGILQAISEGYDSTTAKEMLNLLQYQDLVAKNLLGVAQVITLESSGIVGLKYGQDGNVVTSLSANYHPLTRLPKYITTSDGKVIELYRVDYFGYRRLTEAGKKIILRNSKRRGA